MAISHFPTASECRRGRWVWVAALLAIAGIAPSAQAIDAVATTGMIGDLVKRVGGEHVEVISLMGPGVDPHLYKATASDVRELQRADVVFYNDLLLEGKMTDVFARMASAGRHVYAITAGLPHDELIEPDDASGHPDPHVWFDVALWARCVDAVRDGLVKADGERAA